MSPRRSSAVRVVIAPRYRPAMTRRTIQPAAQERAALQASRRMVARGERPAYRLFEVVRDSYRV
jgi:hypothetical protein